MSRRDKSKIKLKLKKLQDSNVNFTSIELQRDCGLENRCSNLTFRRNLKAMGYEYLINRKKGVLNASDKKKRVAFAKKIVKQHEKGNQQLEYWQHGVSLYTDIVGFEYKVYM